MHENVSKQTEGELVEAALAGDVDSFGELYCRYYSALVGVAYCAVRDRQLAEDAVQEAFAVACHDLPRLRSPDKFSCWIRTIVRRVAARMARSGRECSLPEEIAAPSTARPGERPGDVVHEAVMSLPNEAREVVVLFYFSRLSHKQIAAMLGISPEAVHGRLVRARRRLAGKLQHHDLTRAEP